MKSHRSYFSFTSLLVAVFGILLSYPSPALTVTGMRVTFETGPQRYTTKLYPAAEVGEIDHFRFMTGLKINIVEILFEPSESEEELHLRGSLTGFFDNNVEQLKGVQYIGFYRPGMSVVEEMKEILKNSYNDKYRQEAVEGEPTKTGFYIFEPKDQQEFVSFMSTIKSRMPSQSIDKHF